MNEYSTLTTWSLIIMLCTHCTLYNMQQQDESRRQMEKLERLIKRLSMKKRKKRVHFDLRPHYIIYHEDKPIKNDTSQ
jgi:hypothetical protein